MTTEPSDNVAQPSPAPAVRWLIRVLALAALAVATYLFIIAMKEHGRPIGCGASSGCSAVLASRWSSWLGIPVSFAAVVTYLIILAASLHIGPASSPKQQRGAWHILVAMAVMVALAVAWFAALQVIQLKQICVYCMTDHALGLVLAAIILAATPVAWRSDRAGAIRLPGLATSVLVGLVGVAALVGGQVWHKPSTMVGLRVDQSPVIDFSGLPSLGPRQPHVLVCLVDYTCPHCRVMHRYLMEAKQRYGDQIALTVLPVPLDSSCNPAVTETEPMHKEACKIATVAMAVWVAKPEAFAEFDRWLFDSDDFRTYDAAMTKAAALVGREALDKALAGPEPTALIRRGLELHKATRGADGEYARLPKVISTGLLLVGQPASADEVFTALEHDLGVRPK